MKKLLLAAAFAATFSVSAIAATGSSKYDDSKNVSYFVINQFNTDFSNAENVAWTVTPSSQKADFTIDEVKMTAFYSLNGTYLGLTQEDAYKHIPASAKKEISETYKGYAVGQVIRFQAAEPETYNAYTVQPETTSYFVDLKNADKEVLVRVSAQGGVYFFKQIK